MNRSHLVLVAAGFFGLLAVVELIRDGRGEDRLLAAVASEPEPAAEAAPPPVSAAGPVAAAARARVSGRVTNTTGDRVPGVRITVLGASAGPASSDAAGSFALEIERSGAEPPTMRFSADGYEDASVPLDPASLADGAATVDVRLTPRDGAVLSGTLRGERGAPLAGETIHLQAAARGLHYRALTDDNGRFSLPGVPPGSGYYLSVRPAAGYGDFQQALEIGTDGRSVDIALRALRTESIRARLVDPAGNAIPGLSLSIVSGQALGRSLAVETDSDGYLTLEDVPTGQLVLQARTPAPLVINGIPLRPGASGDVLVRADLGEESMRGRIVDADGHPVKGAEVALSWSAVGDEGMGRSARSSVTGADGTFHFERLSAGIHRLAVRAPGYRDIEVDAEVSSGSPGLEVALEATQAPG